MAISVSFPVFAAQGLRLEVSGWGGGDGDPVDMVSILHDLGDPRWIEIESEIAEDDFHLPDARRDAAARLRSSGYDPVEAPSEPRPMRVDGIEVPFAFASSGDRWVAIGVAGDVTITVQAGGMDAWAVELRAVVDPARLLDGGIPEYRPSRQEHDVLDPRRIVELADATPLADLGATLAGLTLPDEDAPPMVPLGLGFGGARQSDIDHLWKLRARLHAEQGWHHRAGQVLGWPAWQNDDGTEHLASLRNGQALEWTLLLQTDAVDAELYVMLPAADLAAARFDRAEATIEHD